MPGKFSNPFVRFVVTAAALYIAWTAFYELWLHPDREFELFLVDTITAASNWILSVMGYDLIPGDILEARVRTLGIDGTYGVYIADSCAGVPLLALFAGFIIAYPGPFKVKLIYIPAGLIAIHFINILRITGLCLLAYYAPETLDFNHHYTFIVVVYVFIFLLWVVWVNRFGTAKKAQACRV